MTAHKLHAVAAAFLLGTATLGGATLLMTAPAVAAVRAIVGEPLQQAMALAAKGDYKGAMSEVEKASAAPGRTPEETSTIGQVKAYIGAKSGDISLGGSAAAKNKLASDYAAKNYAAVIADGDALSKAGALDGTSAAVVAQSYYLSGNKAGCIKYVKNAGSAADEAALQLEMKCAFDLNDGVTQRDALEQLVARTGKAEYWKSLIKLVEAAKNLSDPQSLQIERIKYLTGSLSGKDDYINLAQLDLQLGLPAEASTVLDKGTAAGLLNDDRSKKLQALAKQQSAQVSSGLAAAQAAAAKDANGDALIKVCLQQYSMGQAKDAVATCKSGVAKNPKDKDSAVVALGLVQVAAGQSADAIKTLNADKGDGNGPMIAHLYALYAAHPGAGAAAAPAAAAGKKKK
jgi:hypothetical protein